MTLSGSSLIDAPRPRVFSALTDPAILQPCVDGCEKIVKTAADHYEAHLKLGVVGMKRTYLGKVLLADQRPPEGFTLQLEGKSGLGFVKGRVQLELVEQGGQTRLNYAADIQVGGLIAALGARRIEPAAKKMLAEFFRKFAEQAKQTAAEPQ